MDELVKSMPNGGAVIAIIFVVIVFLKEMSAARKDYIDHLREVTGMPPRKDRKQ